MMNLYHRYVAGPAHLSLNSIGKDDLDTLAWESIGIVTGAGWCISQHVFDNLAIHPFGANGTAPWTKEDADLSRAVIISMSASGKTARGFGNAVFHDRKAVTEPLGFLAVTESQDPDLIPPASFATKVVRYQSLREKATFDWIKKIAPSKIIVLDFGARGQSLSTLLQSVNTHISDVPVTIIGVGSEMKVLSPSEKAEKLQQSATMPNRIQMNTSDVYDEAMKMLGEKKFFEEKQQGWDSFVKNGGFRGMRLEWEEGVQGIEKGWQRLCEQKVPGDVGMVFRLGGN